LIFAFPYDYDFEPQSYYFEFLSFKADEDGKSFLEIFSQIPTQNLQFVKKNGEFRARYELSIALFDWNEFLVVGSSYKDTVSTASIEEIDTLDPFQLVRFAFLVESGVYEAQVRLTDLESRRYFSFKKEVKVPDYAKAGLQVSDLQIATSIETSNEESILAKSNRKIFPNVPRIYGPEFNTLYVYAEIYNLDYSPEKLNKDFVVTFSIQNNNGFETNSKEFYYKKPGESCAVSVGIPIDELVSGQYTLILNVEDLDSAQKVQKSTHFNIVRPFFKFTDYEFTKLVRQLSYVASSNEIEYLTSLSKPERAQGMYKFWQQRDPTPGTEQNEFMLDFFRRLNYANEHFYNVRGEGWETDQGKIYIRYGRPDYIDRISSAISNKTYEVWEYTRMNRKYLFVDTWGFGEFRLHKFAKTLGAEFTLHDKANP
jgi:GWxTD domain-containing protein